MGEKVLGLNTGRLMRGRLSVSAIRSAASLGSTNQRSRVSENMILWSAIDVFVCSGARNGHFPIVKLA